MQMDIPHRYQELLFVESFGLKVFTFEFIDEGGELALEVAGIDAGLEQDVGIKYIVVGKIGGRSDIIAPIPAIYREEEAGIDMRGDCGRTEDARHPVVVITVGTAADMYNFIQCGLVAKYLLGDLFRQDDGIRIIHG